MTLHLIKLCVGVDTIGELEDWIDERLRQKRRKKQPAEHIHTTRMLPTRKDELLDGGSLYWVIRGEIACRERFLDIRSFVDKEGIKRCRLVMDGKVVPVMPRPRGPFQGWRYLPAKEAPTDLSKGGEGRGAIAREIAARAARTGIALSEENRQAGTVFQYSSSERHHGRIASRMPSSME